MSRPATTDAELVARVLDQDRDAFAEVYDRYADRLFDFAYAMVRHREDAADAVADAFVIFAERLGQLRDPDRLRPWLYSIVRSECLRRLRGKKRVSFDAGEQAESMADQSAGPERAAELGDLRELVWAAAAGLADRDRAVLDLHLRQGLEGAELAAALEVTPNNAYVMLNRLKAQVDRSLGALLVARLGREECEELGDLLTGWDGTFSPLIRKRVARHVDRCALCGERRRTLVSPLALLASVPALAAPAALRDRVLGQVDLVSAGTAANGAPRAPSGRFRRPGLLTAITVLLALLVLGGVALFAADDPFEDLPAQTLPTPVTPGVPAVTLTAGASPQPSDTPAPTESPTAAAPEPASLALGTRAIAFGAISTTADLVVGNSGGVGLDYRISGAPAWLAVAGGTGHVPGGSSTTVRLTADRSGLSEGGAAATLLVDSTAGGATLSVTIEVERPPAIGVPRVPANPGCTAIVTVLVTDESGVASVVLHWSGPGGESTAAMTSSSGDGWSGTAGPFAQAGTVTLWAVATDTRGNVGTGPTVTVDALPCPG